jgi:mannose-6-phosphate isomerase
MIGVHYFHILTADLLHGGVAERRGSGLQILLHGFKSRLHLYHQAPLTKRRKPVAQQPESSIRPWGHYEVLQEAPTFKVKCIWVKSGKRLSYQRHEKRSEHWYIVQGEAEVTLNGIISHHIPGDTVEVKVGDLHRISNISDTDVIFIEVQTGSYFGEDDIERVEDDYGR